MSEGHKMIGKKTILGVIALLALTALVFAGAISASSAADGKDHGPTRSSARGS